MCLAYQARLVILSERERAKNLSRPNGEILRPRKRGLRMTALNTYPRRSQPYFSAYLAAGFRPSGGAWLRNSVTMPPSQLTHFPAAVINVDTPRRAFILWPRGQRQALFRLRAAAGPALRPFP